MSICVDYANPIIVNGFRCKNCTDVDYAKKHIDPEHPKSGPYGVNAASDPLRNQAVTFGVRLNAVTTRQAENTLTSVTSTLVTSAASA